MIRMNGAVHALDFRETAPLSAHPELFKDKQKNASITGLLPSRYLAFPRAFGRFIKVRKLKWSTLFDDAIRLAQDGFPVSGDWPTSRAVN